MTGLDWDTLTAYAAGPLIAWLAYRHPSLPWWECEEAAAEALARLWAWRARFDSARGTGVAWLARVADRILIDRERVRLRYPVLSLVGEEDRPDPAPGPERQALAAWQVATLASGLPPRQARVLLWHHGAGMPLGELAATWGVSEATVRMAAYHGRQTARAHWAGWEAA